MSAETAERIIAQGEQHEVRHQERETRESQTRFYGVSQRLLEELESMPIETPEEEALGRRETPHELLYRLVESAEEEYVIRQASYSGEPTATEILRNEDWIPADQRRVIERKMFEEMVTAGITPDSNQIAEQYEETMATINNARAVYRMEQYLRRHNIPVTERDTAVDISNKYNEAIEAEADRQALDTRQEGNESVENRLRRPISVVNPDTGEELPTVTFSSRKHPENFHGLPIEKLENTKIQPGIIGLAKYTTRTEEGFTDEPFVYFDPSTVMDATIHVIPSYEDAGSPPGRDQGDYPNETVIRVRETQQIPGTNQTITYERFYNLRELINPRSSVDHLARLRAALEGQRKRKQEATKQAKNVQQQQTANSEQNTPQRDGKRHGGFSLSNIFGIGRRRNENDSDGEGISQRPKNPGKNNTSDSQEKPSDKPKKPIETGSSGDEAIIDNFPPGQETSVQQPTEGATNVEHVNISMETTLTEREKLMRRRAKEALEELGVRIRKNGRNIALIPLFMAAGIAHDSGIYNPTVPSAPDTHTTHTEQITPRAINSVLERQRGYQPNTEKARPEKPKKGTLDGVNEAPSDLLFDSALPVGSDGLWGISGRELHAYLERHHIKLDPDTFEGLQNALMRAQEQEYPKRDWDALPQGTTVMPLTDSQIARLIQLDAHGPFMKKDAALQHVKENLLAMKEGINADDTIVWNYVKDGTLPTDTGLNQAPQPRTVQRWQRNGGMRIKGR